jgi:tetratricopeptide (TPR) repeat protein
MSETPYNDQVLRQALGSLAQEPDIARALDENRPHLVYRLLQKKCATAGIVDRQRIEELLRNRRLFAVPIGKPPRMYTLNGIGTSLYGNSEFNPDEGTYIATLFIVLVFLPVYPLSQYLVKKAEERGWYFLAKVPLSAAHRLWKRIILAGLAAALCIIAGVIYYMNVYSTLHVANALDVPVSVSIDNGKPLKVPASSHMQIKSVRKGRRHIAARTADNRLIEEFDAEVPSRTDVIVYNILGAAPLYAQNIQYYAKSSSLPPPGKGDKEEFEVYCGKRFITRDHVRYVFREPDKEIKIGEGSKKETRWCFDEDKGGWPKTVQYLLDEQRTADALNIARGIATADPDNELALGYTVQFSPDQKAGIDWLGHLLEMHPQSISANRFYQDFLQLNGRTDEVRARYRQLHQQHPDSPIYGYLRVRMEALQDALPLYAELTGKYPEDPYLRRGYSWVLMVSHRFAEALQQFEKLAALDPEKHSKILSGHARALLGLGRTADAVGLMQKACDDAHAKNKLTALTVILYDRVARLNPPAAARPAEEYLKMIFEKEPISDDFRAFYLSRVEPAKLDDALMSRTTDPNLNAALCVLRDVPGNMKRALEQAKKLQPEQLGLLDDSTLLLLAGLAASGGDVSSAERFMEPVAIAGSEAALKKFIMKGEESPALAELDLEEQAIVNYARARKRIAAGQPAGDLLRQALKDDLLQGPVTRVIRYEHPDIR